MTDPAPPSPGSLEDRIRQTLLERWDPLGVRDQPMGAERYACQVQDLTLLMLGDSDDEELTDYLRGAETNRLGLLDADEARVARTVAALRALRPPTTTDDAAVRAGPAEGAGEGEVPDGEVEPDGG